MIETFLFYLEKNQKGYYGNQLQAIIFRKKKKKKYLMKMNTSSLWKRPTVWRNKNLLGPADTKKFKYKSIWKQQKQFKT